MPTIRTTRTASGATAVQVVAYRNGRTCVLKHIGSSHTDEELALLREHARRFVERESAQAPLFDEFEKKRTFSLQHTRLLRTTHLFSRAFFQACAQACGLSILGETVLDFAIMRLIEPSSKLRALELIERYFAIKYSKRVYDPLRALFKQKDAIERTALAVAQTMLKDKLFLVLYDVTTLYFETFKADELRVQGFSKDDKSKQPQIVVGLLTTKSGFPLAHEIFSGKTFEGATMLPVLEEFSRKHGVEMPIVVADAAMLSKDNITKLADRKLRYIVGGRLANTSPSLVLRVSKALGQKDGQITRLTTAHHGDMLCSFSAKRFRKDKREMEKQIERANGLIAKNETGRRAKFVTRAGKTSLNEKLIEKTKSLLGIKAYCTNIPESALSNGEVIECYHALWNVEYSFRMSKHDLEARPIFHRKDEAVRAHVLLCFVSLMMGRYLEISTGLSIRRIRDLVWGIEEAHLEDTLTRDTFTLRMSLDALLQTPLGNLLRRWNFPY